MECSVRDASPSLQTQWHQHLVSSLLREACADGAVALDARGRRTIVFERPAAQGPCSEIVLRRETAADTDESQLVALRHAPQSLCSPALGLGQRGHVVVAWHERDDHQVLARRFGPDGAPQGEPFVVNSSTEPVPRLHPRVAVNAAGAFVVLWEHGWTHLRARLYGPQGRAFGPEIDVCLARRTATA